MEIKSEIVRFLINTLVISIPEEAFIVACTLLIAGKGRLLTLKMPNIIRFLVPVVAVAAISSFMRNVLLIEYKLMPFFSILVLGVFLPVWYKIKDFKSILICFCTSIISFTFVGLIQFLYAPIILSYSNITVQQMNTFSWILVLCSLPERILEAIIIAFLITKSRSIVKINLIKVIGNNKAIMFIFLANILINLTFVYTMTVAIYSYNILDGLPSVIRIIISLQIIVVPLCSLGGMIFIVYLITYKGALKQLYIVEETKVMNALVDVLSKNNEYKEIKNEVKEFETQISNLDLHGVEICKRRRETYD